MRLMLRWNAVERRHSESIAAEVCRTLCEARIIRIYRTDMFILPCRRNPKMETKSLSGSARVIRRQIVLVIEWRMLLIEHSSQNETFHLPQFASMGTFVFHDSLSWSRFLTSDSLQLFQSSELLNSALIALKGDQTLRWFSIKESDTMKLHSAMKMDAVWPRNWRTYLRVFRWIGDMDIISIYMFKREEILANCKGGSTFISWMPSLPSFDRIFKLPFEGWFHQCCSVPRRMHRNIVRMKIFGNLASDGRYCSQMMRRWLSRQVWWQI